MRDVLLNLMLRALESGVADYVLTPSRGPGGTFPWILVNDVRLLDRAEPFPPVMYVQGAKALASFARSPFGGKVLAVMRPCEARAAVELSKLDQVTMQNVYFLTMDCPGAVPVKSYRNGDFTEPDPGEPESLRPLCRQCTHFTGAGDLFLALHGGPPVFRPVTGSGRELLETLGMETGEDRAEWVEWRDALLRHRKEARKRGMEDMRRSYTGLGGLARLYGGCISCRNCRTVCPICYCRLCFIDMKDRRSPASDHLHRSGERGGDRLPGGTLLFHMGRMAHMSLSCVSCGMCEDACPSDIPVGRMVSMVSEKTAAVFGYEAGRDTEEPLPLNTFEPDELHEYED